MMLIRSVTWEETRIYHVIVNNTLHFACGERKFCPITKRSEIIVNMIVVTKIIFQHKSSVH